MSLFDRLANGNEKLSPKGALVLAALTLVMADGEVDDEEIAMVNRMVDGDGQAFEEAMRAYKLQNSFDALVQQVTQSTNNEQKNAIMANLLDIAMADGILVGDETFARSEAPQLSFYFKVNGVVAFEERQIIFYIEFVANAFFLQNNPTDFFVGQFVVRNLKTSFVIAFTSFIHFKCFKTFHSFIC